MKLYKVLGKDGQSIHGGNATWGLPHDGQHGEWMPPIDDLKMCKRGYHLVEAYALPDWLDADCHIFEAESEGTETEPHNGKHCCRSARLLKEMTQNGHIARLFACDCAERALALVANPDPRSVEAVAVARRYANGEITDAARAAAGDAAWNAAWNAERQWQGERLEMYLRGEGG